MNNDTLHDAFTTLRFTAAGIMTFLSCSGLFLNFSVFYGLITQKQKVGGFYKLCGSKTISNSAICSTFLIWAIPCTASNTYYLPHHVNVLFGQYGGWGPYIMGPFTQLCMAMNRFFALFLPQFYSKQYSFPISLAGVIFFWVVSFVITSIGLAEGCGFIYVIKRLAWEPEESKCAVNFAIGFFYLIVATSVFAAFFNAVIATRLITMSNKNLVHWNISTQQQAERYGLTFAKEVYYFYSIPTVPSNETNMYVEAKNVTQDSLHVMDTMNCSFISNLSDEVWFRFFFSSVSFLAIHVFDGLVMVLFNAQLRPPCFERENTNQISIVNGKCVFKRKGGLTSIARSF